MKVYAIQHKDGLWKSNNNYYGSKGFLDRAKFYGTLNKAKNALSNLICPSEEDDWTIYEFELEQTHLMYFKKNSQWEEHAWR